MKQDEPENHYLRHQQWHRFVNYVGEGVRQIAREHARTIAEAHIRAGQQIDSTLKGGFEQVQKSQRNIHEALIDQTGVIRRGLDAIELELERGFEQTGRQLEELTSRVDNLGHIVIETGDRLFKGMSGIKASMDMGMMNIITQFELQRGEMREGLDKIAHLLENQHQSRANERFRDGKEAFDNYVQHPDEPQFLLDAKKYFNESVEFYRGNPFAHLYLAHIYHEAGLLYDLERAQEHYQLCATYAKGIHNDPLTALGYFMAAWIAYVRGNVEEAVSLGQQGLQYDVSIPEAYYNLGKYNARLQQPNEAIIHLDHAIQYFDPLYSVKANMDEDYLSISGDLNQYFMRIRDEAAKDWDKRLKALGLSEGPESSQTS